MRFLFLALSLLILPVASRADDCPRTPYASVTVSTKQDYPQTVTSVNIAGLQGLRGGQDSAATDGREHVPLGLTSAQTQYQIQLKAQVAQLHDGTYCVAFRDVDVEYEFKNTTVYIANEIPPYSCVYNEVMNHEQRHVSVDAQLLREWQFRLQQDTEYAVRNQGTLRGPNQQQLMEQLKANLREALRSTSESLMAERKRRQSQVDTRMEYDRVSRSCNGAAQDIVRKALGY